MRIYDGLQQFYDNLRHFPSRPFPRVPSWISLGKFGTGSKIWYGDKKATETAQKCLFSQGK